ncbi:uncharacterized protein A4U43_C04F16050 [Asparagus officinalis]|uniref:Uncharacterized protein n=1 Tax=Asparagus officinalis TaxID=4686 RepID=A0A5P1F189_ASPOF|nr:uncharacterized protein A4U43_C04F16050 [Asparagus officinalis]
MLSEPQPWGCCDECHLSASHKVAAGQPPLPIDFDKVGSLFLNGADIELVWIVLDNLWDERQSPQMETPEALVCLCLNHMEIYDPDKKKLMLHVSVSIRGQGEIVASKLPMEP